MKTVLLSVLVSSLAWGEDAPRMVRLPPGQLTTTEPAWLLNEPGKAKLDAVLDRHFAELVQLRSENAQLRVDVVRLAGEPALTWKGALALVGVGLLVGVAVAVPVSLSVRR